MPRESDKTKVLIRLFDGDLERLRLYYPDHPYNAVVRQLVNRHLNQLDKARASRLASSAQDLPEPDEVALPPSLTTNQGTQS